MKQFIFFFLLFLSVTSIYAEDGSRLWLRYESLPNSLAVEYSERISSCISLDRTETGTLALQELQTAYKQFFGEEIKIAKDEACNPT